MSKFNLVDYGYSIHHDDNCRYASLKKMSGGGYTDQAKDKLDLLIRSNPVTEYKKILKKDKDALVDIGLKESARSIYETHNLNGHKVEFFSVTEKDTAYLKELCDLDEDFKSKPILVGGQIIGVRFDGELYGYVEFILKNEYAEITRFYVKKGLNNSLIKYLSNYLSANNYTRIITSHPDKLLWRKQGFVKSGNIMEKTLN